MPETLIKSNIRDLPVAFLMNFGHCGIDYLHSLMDGHPQILIMPAFSFYRSWKKLGCAKIKDPDEMFLVWHNHIKNSAGMQVIRRKLFYDKDESDKFYVKFREILESSELTPVNTFYALHSAYSFARNIDLSNIRAIVAHEHVSFYLESVLSGFPRAKILQIVRDPRATMAGAYRAMTKAHGYLYDYYFNILIEQWFQAFENWKKYSKKLSEKYKVVRNEDLHANLEKEARALADWLGVDFLPSLLECTFSGRPWAGESAYMTADNKYPEPEETYFLPEKVKERWIKELSAKEIVMIEFLTAESMKQFGYGFLRKSSVFNKLYAFFVYLLPHRGLFRRWLRAYPDLDEFNRVSRNLKNNFAKRTWKYSPAPVKFIAIVAHSIMLRAKIYFFPGNRGQRYV